MPRPNAEQKFQQFLEESLRAIIAHKDATIDQKIEAVREGRELLQAVPSKKSSKDMFE